MTYLRPGSDENVDQLFILNGELRGVSVHLGDDQLHLGSSSDDDVVLVDDLADGAGMTISSCSRGKYVIGNVTGKVLVGRRTLQPGKVMSISSGTPIRVGGVEMMLSASLRDADRAVQSQRRRAKGMLWVASAVGVLAVISLLGVSGLTQGVVAKPSLAVLGQSSVSDSAKTDAAHAILALNERLEISGLGPFEMVEDPHNRVIKVTGKLRRSDRHRWISVIEWFDVSYGKSIYLDAHLTPIDDAITLPFSVEAVWAGSTPRVTLHDGSKRILGDELPGGWRLDAITENSVTISKNEETLNVPL